MSLSKSMTVVTFFLAFTLAACSYRRTEPELPTPDGATNQGIEKTFFVEGKKAKTFLCGWAAEESLGQFGEYAIMHNSPIPGHCNMIFEITERQLVGKQINPSFPDDPSKWVTIVTIPIVSHYYFEKEKDGRGRDTDKFVENSSRSHWSARPYMKLDLSGLQIHKFAYTLVYGESGKIVSVDDIEWDKEKNFLGFTVNAMGSFPGMYALGGGDSSYQGRFRINFLEFKHNPQFTKTPFHDSDYKFMNILHVMGKTINGAQQQLFASHWDLSKPHEIHLVDFPPAYEKIARRVIEDWNTSLKEVGALKNQKGFVVSDRKLKHKFDLRYTTMVWVADERISANSPLGFAMAHADVRNGELLWGGITLFGGQLESYIKSYSSTSGGLTGMAHSIYGSISRMFSEKLFAKEAALPPSLQKPSYNIGGFSLQNLKNLGITFQATSAQKAQSGEQISGLKPEHMSKIIDSLSTVAGDWSKSNSAISFEQLQDRIFPGLSSEMRAADSKLSKTHPDKVSIKDLRKSLLSSGGQSNVACLDRTFELIGPEFSVAAKLSGRSFDEVMEVVVNGLISHEYGHFLGLGHQFKENILPEPDSVPAKYMAELDKKATSEAGFTNATSVMGYRSPLTEVAEKDPEKPGPQDKLVLRYLYNQTYSTYKKGDEDFQFKPVPANGVIPESEEGDNTRKTAYFPQCNDIDASYGLDPYCNRFDRGHNAYEIVRHYFENIDANLVQGLFAFTDNRSRPEAVEGRLWWRAFDNLGRIRVFHDYMRHKFQNQIAQISYDEPALFEFSNACKQETLSAETVRSSKLLNMLKEKPELKDLCKANAYALSKIKELVSINSTDYTKRVLEGRYSPGGIRGGESFEDFRRIDGNWTEMTSAPLKLTSLYALTSPIPWVNVQGWNIPVMNYDDNNLKYSYSSLYPQEYTEIMAANISSNLRFASLGNEDQTLLGRSVLSMLMFNRLSQENNDPSRFSDRYISRIRNQTAYDFQYVAIILEGTLNKKRNDPNRVTHFNGKVFDFSSGKSTPVNDIYLLPNGEVLARAKDMFLLPLTRLQLYADQEGYVIAIRLSYYREHDDTLERLGAKTALRSLYDNVISACTVGVGGNGLSNFFSRTQPAFEGFYMPEGTATDEEKYREFLRSINKSFDDYYKFNQSNAPKPETCREALRGVALVVSAASVLNGYWIGPVGDLIQK